jgi:high-affinity iron transporter
MNGKARWGLGLLAFQAVGREGLETMVFTLAIVFASSSQSATHAHGSGLLVGAALGLVLSLAIAYAIFKLGRRLNLAVFFRTIGVILMVFAAGLLADAVENMQELGWLPFLGGHVWDSSRFLSEDSSLGDVFHSLLGYADHPTVLQVIVWVTYVSVATTLFIARGRRSRRPPTAGVAPGPRVEPAAPVAAASEVAPIADVAPVPHLTPAAAAPPGHRSDAPSTRVPAP